MGRALLPVVLGLAASPPFYAADVRLEVGSGGADREPGAIVRWALPQGLVLPEPWRLVGEDGKEVPAQLEMKPAKAMVWVLDAKLPRWSKRGYRIEAGAPAAKEGVACQDRDGKHLVLEVKGRPAFRYNYAVIEPKPPVEPIFARSGYIHPLWTPSGLVATGDSPPNHKHHHGVWMPWTKTRFEGREPNFWEQGFGTGKVECVGVSDRVSGPVFAGFRTQHRFSDLKAPGGPKPVLEETWTVAVYSPEAMFVIDFTSEQICSSTSPLVLPEYRYGGFGFRGPLSWEGKDGAEFLTSEGRTRADGHATRARWCAVSGKVDGKVCGVLFLCHPSNFRHPQPMRIHPDEPFFNFTPCQAGDFAIEPGKPYVSRYRMVVHDGKLEAAEAERIWKDYTEPPEVDIARG
jgi:hypothetical protein